MKIIPFNLSKTEKQTILVKNSPIFQAGRNLFDGERARGRVPPETHQQMVARRRLETVMRHRARAERHMRHREGNRARAIDALGEADLAQERRELMERRLRQIEHVIDEIRRQVRNSLKFE